MALLFSRVEGLSSRARRAPRNNHGRRGRGILAFMMTICFFAAPLTGASADGSVEVESVHLETQVIPDPARQNMAAMRVLVPKGWEVKGGIKPTPPGYQMLPYLADITLKAPDGRGVRFFGINEFGYADGVNLPPYAPFQGRPFFPLQPSLGDFWLLASRVAPAPGISDVEVVSEEVLAETTELVRRQLAALYQSTEEENARIARYGQHKTFDVHARRLTLRYRDQGRPIEATVFATVRHSIYRYQGGPIKAAMWNLDNMYAVFGPAGTDYLNDPVLAAMVRSREVSQAWQQAVQEWYLRKNRQIVAQGQAAIARAARAAARNRASTSSDILDSSFESWKRRQGMQDEGHARAINGIHERTTYGTPDGGRIDLPANYRHVYTNRLGDYVLHNDANYEVNTDPALNSQEWTRVEPVR